MKKNIPQHITKITTSLLLSAGLILGGMPATMCTAAASDTSSFSTRQRVYDASNDGLIRYHLEDEEGNTITTNSVSKSAAARKKASSLPASYDLRTVNAVSSIKNQGITGCCWAFAAIKSMESNLALKGLADNNTLDLSESHLSWYTYHPSAIKTDPLYEEGISYDRSFWGNVDEYDEGGNADLAAFTLARWSGAVTEETAPFTGESYEEIEKMVSTMKEKNDELHYIKDYILTDSVCYDGATQEEIKEAIMTVGAIDLSYYHNKDYFNKNTNSYYQTELIGRLAIKSANHSVNIIGWDDNYPKENFAPSTPSNDGAWLIANSYGDDFADNGYSWISYNEPSLTEFYTYSATTSDTYDNNYQYDGFGWSSSIADTNATTTQGGNIYTANKESDQNLTAIGIYTLADNQPYTIYVHRGVTAGYPASGTLVAAISGTQRYQGYHTVTFDKPVSLKAGERFSVLISYDRTDENTGYIPVEGSSEKTINCDITYHSNSGESYLFNSATSEWIDTGVKQMRNDLRNNVCIKAFTINVDKADDIPTAPSPDNQNGQNNNTSSEPAATIQLAARQVRLGVGETYAPVVMLTNAAGLALSYNSSDTAVATISSTGTITAKSTGTAKITITLSSGVSTTLTVKVKDAPTKLTLKPSGKKNIAKNKSFRIKVKLPEQSASNTITYTSSKPSVAKVNANGRVTARKKGKTVITVKTFNGITAKLTVKVK